MPLARFSLYESGVEIYIASTADDGDAWQATLVHIARESRAFVVARPTSSAPPRTPTTSRCATRSPASTSLGRGGSAILAPDGSYLAGPLYDEEGILYADLEPQRLDEERQRFDPAGHYHRPDVLELKVRPLQRDSSWNRFNDSSIGDRDQRRLHHLVVRDRRAARPPPARGEVERRPDGAEAAVSARRA